MGHKVTRKSLKTDNLTLAIVIKIKILHHLNINKINPTTYFTFFDTNKLELIKDFEIEQLLEELTATIKRAYLLQGNTVEEVERLEKIEKGTLSEYTAEFIADKEQVGISKKTLLKYKQCISYLEMFFGSNCNVREIGYKEVSSFRRFLFAVPKHWKYKEQLKGKDLKLLIEKNSKLLNGIEKQHINTVIEILKRSKSIFRTFENIGYVEKNYFENLDSIAVKSGKKRAYKPSELKSIFTYCLREGLREEYNFMRSLLYLGLRRGEMLSIQIKSISLDDCTIEVLGTKTDNAHRLSILHKEIIETIKEQIADKEDNDYLFFDSEAKLLFDRPLHRDKSDKDKQELHDYNIGVRTNKIIKAVLGSDIKGVLDIHSIRSNFAQELYMVKEIKDYDLKLLMGHSRFDITEKHYLVGLKNKEALKAKVDLADFSAYF